MTELIPSVTAMLGVSSHAAKKVVDAIFLGLGTIKIIALIISSGASLALGVGLFAKLTKRLGRTAAIGY